MIRLRNNKISFLAILLLGILLSILSTAFKENKNATEQARLLCLEHIRCFQAELDTFQQQASNKQDNRILSERFKRLRVEFKEFEFILEYLNSKNHPFFNGVNAVELEDGYNPNVRPEGLQVMESELYKDTIDYNRIVFLTKQLKYRSLAFYLFLKEAPLRDTYFFEAVRFHLIRIEALSLASFDTPTQRNNIAEIAASLKVFSELIQLYSNSVAEEDISKLESGIQQSTIYLKNKNFQNLDRLYFIKRFLQPIVHNLILLQKKLAIPSLETSDKLFRAVNLNSNTIYDTSFLQPKFYAQDKYYKENPLYTALGKRLFFDNRLSSDGSMSCATCHQPSNYFTDRLPTAITNKAGGFQLRNTPTLLNAALQAAYFYDLSANTLEAQMNHVVSNTHEFNTNFESILKKIKSDSIYIQLFSAAFPEFKQEAVSIYSINTCIAHFERQLVRLNSPFDQYMRGETLSIDASVKRGFNLFMGKAQCGTCHFAPTFFSTLPPFYGISEAEVLGTTKRFDTIHPELDEDLGRYTIIEYEPFKYAFKTSTVRNAALTAPYMHNGGFKTLEEVIAFYDHGGGAGLGLNVPTQTLSSVRLHLTSQDKKDLIAFIKSLTDTSGLQNYKIAISD